MENQIILHRQQVRGKILKGFFDNDIEKGLSVNQYKKHLKHISNDILEKIANGKVKANQNQRNAAKELLQERAKDCEDITKELQNIANGDKPLL